jgi:GGDEF domain-containing protein
VGLAVESDENTGEVIMSRLKEHLNALNFQKDRPYRLSISFGLALYAPKSPCSLEELLERADKLMYEQKQAKKKDGIIS